MTQDRERLQALADRGDQAARDLIDLHRRRAGEEPTIARLFADTFGRGEKKLAIPVWGPVWMGRLAVWPTVNGGCVSRLAVFPGCFAPGCELKWKWSYLGGGRVTTLKPEEFRPGVKAELAPLLAYKDRPRSWWGVIRRIHGRTAIGDRGKQMALLVMLREIVGSHESVEEIYGFFKGSRQELAA